MTSYLKACGISLALNFDLCAKVILHKKFDKLVSMSSDISNQDFLIITKIHSEILYLEIYQSLKEVLYMVSVGDQDLEHMTRDQLTMHRLGEVKK